MAFISHLFLVVLGMSYLFNQTAAVSNGLEDALLLVQQRAQLEAQSATLATILTESFHSNPNGHEDIIAKVVSKVGEERLHQFWEKMIEIGRAPNMSRALRGLLLVQESGRVIGAANGNPLTDWIYDTKVYKSMAAKSEPAACLVARTSVLADIGDLTIAIAYPVGQSCSKASLCMASAFDIVRALVYLVREIASSRYSYCASAVSSRALCGASSLGVFAELAGVLHSSISLEYKCNKASYKSADSSSKIFGVNARAFMCSWDITRGAAYAIAGIYRAFWWFFLGGSDAVYVNDEGRLVRKVRGVEEIGQSGPSYGLMALGGFAWMTNSIIAGASSCPDNSGTSTKTTSACSKEAAELTAYAFQMLGYVQNFRDYCRDIYGKNEIRAEAGNEEAFRLEVQRQWNLMKRYVPTELTPDEIRTLIDMYFNDEAREVLENELEESITSEPHSRRASRSPEELTKVLEAAIDRGLVPQNPRVSIVGGPRFSTASANDGNMLSVPHKRSSVLSSSNRLSVSGSENLYPNSKKLSIHDDKLPQHVVDDSHHQKPLEIPITIQEVPNKLQPLELPTVNDKTPPVRTIAGYEQNTDGTVKKVAKTGNTLDQDTDKTMTVNHDDPMYAETAM